MWNYQSLKNSLLPDVLIDRGNTLYTTAVFCNTKNVSLGRKITSGILHIFIKIHAPEWSESKGLLQKT